MPILTIGIVLDCLYLLIFYSEKFSTWVWRLPEFVVNVNLNLSDTKNIYPEDRSHLLPAVGYFYLTKSRMNNYIYIYYFKHNPSENERKQPKIVSAFNSLQCLILQS